MKTKSLFVAAVAIMMAACSETDNISVQNTAQQPETAVSFDTYMGRATTRAGAVGEITTKEDLQISNFGVFAYYTQNADDSKHYPTDAANTALKPDFMWNQKVEYDGDNWFYFPVKYWPNETKNAGTTNYVDGADPTENHATTTVATAPDKVTFFAYAPYVDASTTGTVTPNTDGITGILTLNTTKSDPRLGYTTPKDPLKTVDLLWGVVPSYKNVYTTVIEDQTMTAGKPNYNLWKQKQDERIMFQFKHALAKLTLDVVGFFDDVPVGGANTNPDAVSENNVAKDTKIVVEYVKLSTEKYPSASVLNLNNYTAADKPEWEQTNNSGNIDFTINGSMLTNLIRYRTPSAPDKGYAEQPRGVTKDAIALLANDASQEAFYGIIPCQNSGATDDTPWKVEVKYHVFTKDANLENGYSEITNVIKKEDIQMTFDPGKHYTLRLRLGMTTVKFDATVEDWIDGATTPADLPINVAVQSLSNFKLTAVANSGAIATGYSGFANQGADFEVDNCSYKLSVAALKAFLENGTSSSDLSAGFMLNSDADWIAYDHDGNFVIAENRTTIDRSAKVWATYGGVDSDPITITQHGSTLVATLLLPSDATSANCAWNGVNTEFEYTYTFKYVDNDDDGKYLDASTEANANGTFSCDVPWITIDKANNKFIVNSKNEDEVNARVATISVAYDGKSSNTVKIVQYDK